MIKKIFLCFLIVSFAVSVQSYGGQKSKKSQAKKRVTPLQALANYGKYDFSFRTLNGKTIRLSDYAGKVVLVNIWAPWCAPCKKETQGFVKLYTQHHAKGFEILGVAVQTNESEVRAFLDKYNIVWQIGIKDELAKMYGIVGLPQSYLFAPDGSLIKEFVGYTDEEMLKPLLENALKFIGKKIP